MAQASGRAMTSSESTRLSSNRTNASPELESSDSLAQPRLGLRAPMTSASRSQVIVARAKKASMARSMTGGRPRTRNATKSSTTTGPRPTSVRAANFAMR